MALTIADKSSFPLTKDYSFRVYRKLLMKLQSASRQKSGKKGRIKDDKAIDWRKRSRCEDNNNNKTNKEAKQKDNQSVKAQAKEKLV